MELTAYQYLVNYKSTMDRFLDEERSTPESARDFTYYKAQLVYLQRCQEYAGKCAEMYEGEMRMKAQFDLAVIEDLLAKYNALAKPFYEAERQHFAKMERYWRRKEHLLHLFMPEWASVHTFEEFERRVNNAALREGVNPNRLWLDCESQYPFAMQYVLALREIKRLKKQQQIEFAESMLKESGYTVLDLLQKIADLTAKADR